MLRVDAMALDPSRVVAVPLAVFVAYLVIESLGFLILARAIGAGWAVIVLIGVFITGLFLATYEMRRLSRRALSRTASVGQAMGDFGLIAAGALLVALPGLVTTALGLLLILPPSRAAVRSIAARGLRRKLEEIGLRSFRATDRYRRQASYGWFTPTAEDKTDIRMWTRTVEPEDFLRPGDSRGPGEDGA